MSKGKLAQDPPNKPTGPGVSPSSPAASPEGQPEDSRDINRFLSGEIAGFEALVNRYRKQAYAIALALTGNHDDAMDAVQKAFIRIYRALPRFRSGEPFFPWLYRIVRNAALNQRRDEKRHRGEIPLEWVRKPNGRPSPLEEATAAELAERLWTGIMELPLEQREVFLLYHFQGKKYREIANVLRIPLGTVMSRLHSARLQLRRCFAEEGTT
jgi:RNA polymerase sigma-70 factor (ECF subfamily)